MIWSRARDTVWLGNDIIGMEVWQLVEHENFLSFRYLNVSYIHPLRFHARNSTWILAKRTNNSFPLNFSNKGNFQREYDPLVPSSPSTVLNLLLPFLPSSYAILPTYLSPLLPHYRIIIFLLELNSRRILERCNAFYNIRFYFYNEYINKIFVFFFLSFFFQRSSGTWSI